MEKIKIGILGYGNLGRGVELSVSQIKYKGCCCVSH